MVALSTTTLPGVHIKSILYNYTVMSTLILHAVNNTVCFVYWKAALLMKKLAKS